MSALNAVLDYAKLSEAELLDRAKRRDAAAFRSIMQRCNQRLFRIARSVVHDDAEAEDVLQEAYVRAFAALEGFRGEASILTWLTRIVLNEARGRLRKRRPTVGLDALDAEQQEAGRVIHLPGADIVEDPERATARAEARRLLERAVDELSEPFRLVFILREVEGCSVEETADSLAINPQTVKTRLHRARRMLRESLSQQLGGAAGEAFPFLGRRCDRITAAVLHRLALSAPLPSA